MTKMTKKEKFALLSEIVNGRVPTADEVDLLTEFCENEVEALNRKASSPKSNPKAEEHEAAMSAILTVLAAGEMSIPDIKARDEGLAGRTPQFMSSMLKKLCDSGQVQKRMDKKTAMFSLTEGA